MVWFLSLIALNWLFIGDTNRMIAEVHHLMVQWNLSYMDPMGLTLVQWNLSYMDIMGLISVLNRSSDIYIAV